ncbi:MAG: hypothetical protein ACFFD4_10620 [Candidatus Odinarchaeota archaeon]
MDPPHLHQIYIRNIDNDVRSIDEEALTNNRPVERSQNRKNVTINPYRLNIVSVNTTPLMMDVNVRIMTVNIARIAFLKNGLNCLEILNAAFLKQSRG